jgi:hypothetical protein
MSSDTHYQAIPRKQLTLSDAILGPSCSSNPQLSVPVRRTGSGLISFGGHMHKLARLAPEAVIGLAQR